MAIFQTVHAIFATGSNILTATVERGTSATGPWTLIGQMALDGAVTPPIVDEGYFYDNTAPFDTAVWYRVIRRLPNGTVDATVIVGPLTLAGPGTVVISDPSRPWADVEFEFCDTPQGVVAAGCTPTGPEFVWVRFGPRLRTSDAGLFPVLDAERPADVYARRKDHSGTGTFLTKTLDAIDRAYDLFTAGGPLYLRAPAAYGRTDFAFQPGDLEEAFLTDSIDQRVPFRMLTFPYTVVDLPLGPQQGTDCANWCAVENAFPTFADLTAAGDTWRDVASGATLCPDGAEDGFGLGPFGGGPFGDGG